MSIVYFSKKYRMASISLLPRMGGVVLRVKNSPFWLPALKKLHRIHISHVVFQKDSTKKFANPRTGSTAVMDRVYDPFVLEHVPKYVDVAFAEDVVNRLKERPQKK